MIISFDMDGVIADTPYEPDPARRTPEFYWNVRATYQAIRALYELDEKEIVYYIISARQPADKMPIHIQRWLDNFTNEATPAGIICGVSPMRKLRIAKEVGATYHFDDHLDALRVKRSIRRAVTPVLVRNYRWEEQCKFWDSYAGPKIRGIEEVIDFLADPSLFGCAPAAGKSLPAELPSE